MARPTKLTRELFDNIVRLVQLGNYPLVAARANGVPDATFYDWLARGRQREDGSKRAKRLGAASKSVVVTGERDPDIYVEFVDAIARAESLVESRTVGTVVIAAQNNDRAALAFLERRYPQRWRQHVTTEMVGPEGGPIRQEVETKPAEVDVDETLVGIIEAMARAGKLPK